MKKQTVKARRNKLGRPPKTTADRKATHFTFRTRGGLREQLQSAAANSGRSVSEEIERRLELSFQSDEILQALQQLTAQVAALRPQGMLGSHLGPAAYGSNLGGYNGANALLNGGND